jgi:hypothetical protein
MRKSIMVSGFGFALIVGTALPASAASGVGAQVYNQKDCQYYPYATVCGTQHAEYNIVETPSGNANYQANGKYDLTVTLSDGSTYTDSGSFQGHGLFLKGQNQEESIHFSEETAAGNGQTCTYSADFHYANGNVQFDNFDLVCTP